MIPKYVYEEIKQQAREKIDRIIRQIEEKYKEQTNKYIEDKIIGLSLTIKKDMIRNDYRDKQSLDVNLEDIDSSLTTLRIKQENQISQIRDDLIEQFQTWLEKSQKSIGNGELEIPKFTPKKVN